jgi:hypothetical protein
MEENKRKIDPRRPLYVAQEGSIGARWRVLYGPQVSHRKRWEDVDGLMEQLGWPEDALQMEPTRAGHTLHLTRPNSFTDMLYSKIMSVIVEVTKPQRTGRAALDAIVVRPMEGPQFVVVTMTVEDGVATVPEKSTEIKGVYNWAPVQPPAHKDFLLYMAGTTRGQIIKATSEARFLFGLYRPANPISTRAMTMMEFLQHLSKSQPKPRLTA